MGILRATEPSVEVILIFYCASHGEDIPMVGWEGGPFCLLNFFLRCPILATRRLSIALGMLLARVR